ncbi:hypothetical protein MSG28_007668 [Choristoneura fumiferana]|uniref:Uncharacterized protein n=1 Tax=Choristoneura fumiferana TaxID=7141 RepID=A0ACC0JYF6_CHOFU|nr:hypothetical protein MSG28_007668 [Choristoneura fumiferana]
MLAISILRNRVGLHTLADLLTIREMISQEVLMEIEKAAAEWGVHIERVAIKNVVLPQELQKAMAAEAEGKRLAKAKIIEAEGEIKTAENLKEASKIIMENPQIMLCLTKDSLSVTVQAVIYYKVFDPLWAVINVSNFKLSTQFLAATILRNTVSSRKLSQLLKNRSDVSDYVLQRMKRLTFEWGISVIRTEIKDISLPLQLQKAMAAEAESSRLANAKIIVASSEIASTKSLQQATVMLMDNPWCMQLRYLQSLHMIAGPQTHTVVFPYSVDLIKKLFSDNDNNK